ncbi:YafY family transcriptional regulator [Nocardioides antri]|uniref:YafY family transcriptional regulator n=2 Tax=Nocardioides antri TaxID=2607659 RepID=A0A5B1M0Q1_9ACTN|nr:YafY family transcriptional regulator [Nocardioides antri]
MRADRMIATLLLMQSRGRVTAAELARELEVSVATARRDLEALSTAGVPVYPQPGRGGGWSLVGGARTDLSGLTAPESTALFTLLGPAASLSPETASAVRKLLRALPGPFRADAESAASAVRLDDLGWGEVGRDRPAAVDVVQQAVIDRVKVRVDYRNRSGDGSTTLLDPLGLVAKDGVWYLIATRDGETDTRTYRMDRVRAVEPTDQPADRPAGFDLAREWRRVVEYVESRRSLVRATVRLAGRHLGVLRDHFGTYLEVVEDDGDRVVVTVAAHTARSVAEQLAGWGAMVEVTGPDAVREELARIGQELAEAYG